MTQYNSGEAKAHLSELLQEAMPGEDVVIARDKQWLVPLLSIEAAGATRVAGSAKGKIIAMAPDFGEPLPDFQDYT